MATNKITYSLDFKADFKDVEAQLQSLKQSLSSLVNMKFDGGKGLASDINAASQAAVKLQGYLSTALDPRTGKLDLSRLNTQMKAAGDSASALASSLLKGGQQGAQAYMQVSNAIINAQKPMHRISDLSKEFLVTLKNTAKWQLSSSLLTGVTSALSNSLQYAKDLDASLNDIRIVTGAGRAEMDRFAISANKVAKDLSTSTKKITDATLIYRQQGDTAAEAAKKAEITVKAANAAGVAAQEMSEYLTGIWNSYQVGASELENFTDKLMKVGAVTATSAEELATSMTKVAATANAVGVSYDQLLSTIATVSSATRISAEQIGTAFKTIYARMGDLELKGAIDEGGITTTLGTISSSLKAVGVNVLDAQGNIRDMGKVVEDLGNKWKTMNLNQQTAIAEAVAGKRQYTQLFALFENWDEYKRTLRESASAQGELNKQQAIYADSIEGAQARFKAAKEGLVQEFINNETLQDSIDLLADATNATTSLIKAAGGLQPIFMTLGSYLMTKFAPQISNGLVNTVTGLIATIPVLGQKASQSFLNDWLKTFDDVSKSGLFSTQTDQMQLKTLKEMTILKAQIEKQENNLTDRKKKTLAIMQEEIQAQQAIINTTIAANKEQEKAYSSYAAQVRVRSGFTGKDIANTEQVDISDLKASEAFKSLDSSIGSKLLGDITGAQAPLSAIAHNFVEMNESAQSLVANSLARYFNDGVAPSEKLVQSTRELLEASSEKAYLDAESAELQSLQLSRTAAVKTELTGIMHIYDAQKEAIVDASTEYANWVEKGPEMLAQQRLITEEIKQAKKEMNNLNQSSQEKTSEARSKIARWGTDTYVNKAEANNAISTNDQSSVSTIKTFVDTLKAGNQVSETTMSKMSGIVSSLRSTEDYTKKTTSAVRILVDTYDLLKGAMANTSGAEAAKANMEALKQKLNELGVEIDEATMGELKLFNAQANFSDEYIDKVANAVKAHKEEVKAIEDEIVKTKELLQVKKQEAQTNAKSSVNSIKGRKVTGTSKEEIEVANTVNEALEEVELNNINIDSFNAVKKAMTGFEHLPAFKNLAADIEKFEQQLREANGEIDKTEQNLDELNHKKVDIKVDVPDPGGNEPKNVKTNVTESIKTATQNIGGIAQTAMSASMAVNSLTSVFDKNASTMERVMGISMGVTSAISALTAATKLMALTEQQKSIKSAALNALETKSIWARISAKLVERSIDPTKAVLALTAALIAGIAAWAKSAGAMSEAAKQEKEFERATKDLEETQEKIAKNDSEIKALQELKTELFEATTAKENLKEVSEKLTEELGVEIDLVNGSASAYAYANSLLEERIRLQREEAEILAQSELASVGRKLSNITVESADWAKGWIKSATATKQGSEWAIGALQKYNTLSKEEKEKFDRGETTFDYGDESVDKTVIQSIESMLEEISSTYVEIISKDTLSNLLPGLTTLVKKGIEEGSFKEEDYSGVVDKLKANEGNISNAIANKDATALQKIFDGIKIPEKLKHDWNLMTGDMVNSVKTSSEEAKKAQLDNQTIVASLGNFSNLSEETQKVVKEFGTTAELSVDTVKSFISKLRETNAYSAEQLTEIENQLLDPSINQEKLGGILGQITVKVITDSDAFKEALDAENYDMAIDVLLEGGVLNARELVQELKNSRDACKGLEKEIGNAKDASDKLPGLANELSQKLGVSAQTASVLAAQYGIVNRNDIASAKKNELLKAYVNKADSLGEELRDALNIALQINSLSWNNIPELGRKLMGQVGITLTDNGFEFEGKNYGSVEDLKNILSTELLDLAAQKETNNNLVLASGSSAEAVKARKTRDEAVGKAEEAYNKAITEAEERKAEAIKDAEEAWADAQEAYQKAMKEFKKKEALELLQDAISRLNESLNQLSNTLDTLDFAEELLGEDMSFETKMDLYTSKLSTLTQHAEEVKSQFSTMLTITPENGEQATEILNKMNTLKEEYQSDMLAIAEIKDSLSTAGIEEIQRVMEEQQELINQTFEAMAALADLNNQQDQYFMQTREKAQLATLMFSTGKLSEKSNERGEATAREAENKKIIKDAKKMEEEVSKFSLKTLDMTIQDRAEARAEEKAEIEKDLADALEEYETALADAEKEYEEALADAEKARNDAITNANKAYNEAMATITTSTQNAVNEMNRAIDSSIAKIKELIEYIESLKGMSIVDGNTVEMDLGAKGKATPIKMNESTSRMEVLSNENGELVIGYLDKNNKLIDMVTYTGSDFEGFHVGDTIKENTTLSQGGNVYAHKQGLTKDISYYGYSAAKDVNSTFSEKQRVSLDSGYKTPKQVEEKKERKKEEEKLNATAIYSPTFDMVNINGELYDLERKSPTTPKLGSMRTYTVKEIQDLGYNIVGYAKGSKSTPAGDAVLGEEGQELVLLPNGKVVMAGTNGIEIANLPKGARVLTAEETKKVLANKKDYANLSDGEAMDAYASGTDNSSISITPDSKNTEEFWNTQKSLYEEGIAELVNITKKGLEDQSENQSQANDEYLNASKDVLNEVNNLNKTFRDENIQADKDFHSTIEKNTKTSGANLNTITDSSGNTINNTLKGKLNTAVGNTNIATGAMSLAAETTATNMTDLINNMKFTLPAIDSQQFISSIESTIQQVFTSVNAERDEKGNINSDSGGTNGPAGDGNVELAKTYADSSDPVGIIWNYFKEKGFSDAGIAGIIGNLAVETGGKFNADSVEADWLYTGLNKDNLMSNRSALSDYTTGHVFPKTKGENQAAYRGSDGNYYAGIGIGSWTGPAAEKYLNYVQSSGKKWDDLTTQLDYLYNGFNERAISRFKSAKTAEEGAKIMFGEHEMPGLRGNEYAHSSFVDRVAAAETALAGDYASLYTGSDSSGTKRVRTKFQGSFVDLITQIAAQGIESVMFKTISDAVSDMSGEIVDFGTNADGWMSPLGSYSITSKYGNRVHPVTGQTHFHGGIDMGATAGSPIAAAKSGTVIGIYNDTINGNGVKIQHDNGYVTTYIHMQKVPPVKIGQEVKQGQTIGQVGSTGRSTGPHLDYRIYKNGQAVNPVGYLPAHAKGGLTKNETALVGEYGREIILYPDGTAGLLGANGMEYANLPAGAQIISNEETEKILNNPVNYKENINPVLGFANGNSRNLKVATPDLVAKREKDKEAGLPVEPMYFTWEVKEELFSMGFRDYGVIHDVYEPKPTPAPPPQEEDPYADIGGYAPAYRFVNPELDKNKQTTDPNQKVLAGIYEEVQEYLPALTKIEKNEEDLGASMITMIDKQGKEVTKPLSEWRDLLIKGYHNLDTANENDPYSMWYATMEGIQHLSDEEFIDALSTYSARDLAVQYHQFIEPRASWTWAGSQPNVSFYGGVGYGTGLAVGGLTSKGVYLSGYGVEGGSLTQQDKDILNLFKAVGLEDKVYKESAIDPYTGEPSRVHKGYEDLRDYIFEIPQKPEGMNFTEYSHYLLDYLEPLYNEAVAWGQAGYDFWGIILNIIQNTNNEAIATEKKFGKTLDKVADVQDHQLAYLGEVWDARGTDNGVFKLNNKETEFRQYGDAERFMGQTISDTLFYHLLVADNEKYFDVYLTRMADNVEMLKTFEKDGFLNWKEYANAKLDPLGGLQNGGEYNLADAIQEILTNPKYENAGLEGLKEYFRLVKYISQDPMKQSRLSKPEQFAYEVQIFKRLGLDINDFKNWYDTKYGVIADIPSEIKEVKKQAYAINRTTQQIYKYDINGSRVALRAGDTEATNAELAMLTDDDRKRIEHEYGMKSYMKTLLDEGIKLIEYTVNSTNDKGETQTNTYYYYINENMELNDYNFAHPENARIIHSKAETYNIMENMTYDQMQYANNEYDWRSKTAGLQMVRIGNSNVTDKIDPTDYSWVEEGTTEEQVKARYGQNAFLLDSNSTAQVMEASGLDLTPSLKNKKINDATMFFWDRIYQGKNADNTWDYALNPDVKIYVKEDDSSSASDKELYVVDSNKKLEDYGIDETGLKLMSNQLIEQLFIPDYYTTDVLVRAFERYKSPEQETDIFKYYNDKGYYVEEEHEIQVEVTDEDKDEKTEDSKDTGTSTAPKDLSKEEKAADRNFYGEGNFESADTFFLKEDTSSTDKEDTSSTDKEEKKTKTEKVKIKRDVSHDVKSLQVIQDKEATERAAAFYKTSYNKALDLYTKYPLMTEEQQSQELKNFTLDFASFNINELSNELDRVVAIYNDYMKKVKAGLLEYDAEYVNQLNSYVSSLSEAVDEETQKVLDTIDNLKQQSDNLVNFTIKSNDIFGWENFEKTQMYLEDLKKTIKEYPEDIERAFEKMSAVNASVISEMQARLTAYQEAIAKETETLEYQNTVLESRKTIQQGYNNEILKYRESLHNINKELAKSKSSSQWFDEQTRKTLFNDEDYLQYSTKISKIQKEALRDYRNYMSQIQNLEEDEAYLAATITEEYQERVALRQKELDILNEEINLERKQNALNNALLERNVRVFTGGRWRQIANVTDVQKAQEDLAETKYQIETKQLEYDQQKEINIDYSADIRANTNKIGELAESLEEAQELVKENTDAINNIQKVNSTSLNEFRKNINEEMKFRTTAMKWMEEAGYAEAGSAEEYNDSLIKKATEDALKAWQAGDTDALSSIKDRLQLLGASEIARYLDPNNYKIEDFVTAANEWRGNRNFDLFNITENIQEIRDKNAVSISSLDQDRRKLFELAMGGMYHARKAEQEAKTEEQKERAMTDFAHYSDIIKALGVDDWSTVADKYKTASAEDIKEFLKTDTNLIKTATLLSPAEIRDAIVSQRFSYRDNLFGLAEIAVGEEGTEARNRAQLWDKIMSPENEEYWTSELTHSLSDKKGFESESQERIFSVLVSLLSQTTNSDELDDNAKQNLYSKLTGIVGFLFPELVKYLPKVISPTTMEEFMEEFNFEDLSKTEFTDDLVQDLFGTEGTVAPFLNEILYKEREPLGQALLGQIYAFKEDYAAAETDEERERIKQDAARAKSQLANLGILTEEELALLDPETGLDAEGLKDFMKSKYGMTEENFAEILNTPRDLLAVNLYNMFTEYENLVKVIEGLTKGTMASESSFGETVLKNYKEFRGAYEWFNTLDLMLDTPYQQEWIKNITGIEDVGKQKDYLLWASGMLKLKKSYEGNWGMAQALLAEGKVEEAQAYIEQYEKDARHASAWREIAKEQFGFEDDNPMLLANLSAQGVTDLFTTKYGNTLLWDNDYPRFQEDQAEEAKSMVTGTGYNIVMQAARGLLNAKRVATERYEMGYDESDPQLAAALKQAEYYRNTMLNFGVAPDSELLGNDMSVKEYEGVLNNYIPDETMEADFDEYKDDAFKQAESLFTGMTGLLELYGTLVTSSAEALSGIEKNFADEMSRTWGTLSPQITKWTQEVTTAFEEIKTARAQDPSVIVTQANAEGTRDSKAGISLVNEKGVEMLSTNYGQLIELNPHQKIFNNDQMNFLYDLSREGLQGMNRTISAISNSMQDNSLSIAHLEVKLDNVTDARSFADELHNLTAYIRNTKTIK